MRKLFNLGLLVCVLALGMMVIGCEQVPPPDPALNGNWTRSIYLLELNNGSCEVHISDTPTIKGTYTTDGTSITLTVTQIRGSYGPGPSLGLNSSTFYTRSQAFTAAKTAYPTYLDEAINTVLDAYFLTRSGTYALPSDNSLTLSAFTDILVLYNGTYAKL